MTYPIPLKVTTDAEAEIEYLDDVVACSDRTGTATYLKNKSDAVWTLHHLGSVPGDAQPLGRDLVAQSFFSATRSPYQLMLPRDKLTIDLPPEELQWDIDLPLSFGWEGHQLVAAKVRQAGQDTLIAAVRRKSLAGGALVASQSA